MNGLAPILMSIAMLAAFFLGAGGLWLAMKRGEKKQGALMVVAALVLLANVLIWSV
jgi:hypothetical protein